MIALNSENDLDHLKEAILFVEDAIVSLDMVMQETKDSRLSNSAFDARKALNLVHKDLEAMI